MAHPPGVSLRDVTVVVGDGVRVLDRLSLDVAAGSHVAIVGPSGSGKTTLLRVLAGQCAPREGSVSVPGRVASIHQDFRLVGSSTALANVLHGAAAEAGLLRSLTGYGAQRRARARGWLETLGLKARANVRVDRLSGGEQQRVAIARSLANRPKVLIADEPTGNLDPNTSRVVFQNLFEIAKQEGVAVLVATHNVELTSVMDRVLTLHDGRLEPAPAKADSV